MTNLLKVIGGAKSSVYSKLTAAKKFGNEWAVAGDYHFRHVAQNGEVAHA